MSNENPYMTPLEPTVPDLAEVYDGPPSSWPAVIGGISIALGVLGVLWYGCTTALSFVDTASFMGTGQGGGQELSEETQRALAAVEEKYKVWSIFNGLAAIALAIFLLVGGINSVRRLSSTRKMHTMWALLKLLFMVNVALATFLTTSESWAIMETDPAMDEFAGAGRILAMAFLAFVVVFLSAYPIFVLIWFNRSRIKQEVAAWP